MNSFALEIFDDECSLVTFYTVRWENAKESETEKFFNFCDRNSHLDKYVNELTDLLFEQIGETYGADKAYFSRHENAVDALPPARVKLNTLFVSYKGNTLRLFCLRLTQNIVILFGGGEKTTNAVQEDKNGLHLKFIEANQMAEAIYQAIKEGYLKINHIKRNLYVEDCDEILLP